MKIKITAAHIISRGRNGIKYIALQKVNGATAHGYGATRMGAIAACLRDMAVIRSLQKN